jgi:quercetin dioxygenase-like cupin family protein
MSGRLLVLLLLATPLPLFSQTRKFTSTLRKPAPFPAQNMQDQYTRQLFTNSHVTVWRVEVPAGASTQMARHNHDFLLISLGTNQFDLAGPVNSVAFAMSEGEVQVVTGNWPNRVVNKSQTAVHILPVEAKKGIAPHRASCGLNSSSCVGARFAHNDQTNYSESPLFETPFIRLSKVELHPASGMPQHRDSGDQLFIALNDQQLLNIVVDDKTDAIDAHAGDVEWFSGGTVHRLANRGTQAARFLTLELK